MDNLNNYSECDFCNSLIIMPYTKAPDVVIDLITKSKKSKSKNNKYLVELLQYTEMSEEFLGFIYAFNPELHNSITKRDMTLCQEARGQSTRNFFDKNLNTSQITNCNFCNRMSCDYHTKHHKFFKCFICNKRTSMCGWCHEREGHIEICHRIH